MIVMQNLSYKNCGHVSVNLLTYTNGRIALQLLTEQAGFVEPLATATVNLPSAQCGPDEVWVKSWSENEGMEAWLIEQGIINEGRGRACESGHVTAYCHKLTPAFQQLMFKDSDPEDEGDDSSITDYTMRQGEMGSPDRQR